MAKAKQTHPIKTPHINYISQPFIMGIEGMKLLYQKGRGIFWLALIISIISFGSNLIRNNAQTKQVSTAPPDPQQALATILIALFVLAAVAAFVIIIWGMFSYTSARLAENKTATIKEAFKATFDNFWKLTVVGMVMFIRLLGWMLLFFIPAFIMSFRYSLAGLMVFAEPNLKASEIVSKSAKLTKNAWFDTFGTQTLIPLLTLGLLSANVQTGVQAKLYKQLTAVQEKGIEKPPTHWLNYLTLVLLIVLVIAIFSVIAALTYYILSDPSYQELRQMYNQ